MNLTSIINNSQNGVPRGLDEAIISKVQRLTKNKARRRMFGFGALSISSFAGLVTWAGYLRASLQTSGVYDYVSILASNTGSISLFWKEIAFSIIESIPFITISVFLTLLVAFVLSGLKTAENIGVSFKAV